MKQVLNGKVIMSKNIYKELSEERKQLQAEGLVPRWYTTSGFQMFKDKYEFDTNGQSIKGQFSRIAKTAAKHLVGTKFQKEAESKFFDLFWNGWLSPSTPVLANMGTTRGTPVSCSGTVAEDSVDGFYSNLHEVAMLTKYGFGTATDLSAIRPRGSKISVGGKASGIMPIIKEHVSAMRNIAQGTARRGAWACYLDIEHGDFNELVDHLSAESDDLNIGWTVKQTFIDRLNQGDKEAVERFQKAMKVKMVTGKGYFFFIDKANEKRPLIYKDKGLFINNSQLCSEIMLHNSTELTYTCVLSSMNAAKYNEWKDTDAAYWATIFLDCVAGEFIERAEGIRGLEKAVKFTEKSRALGLGLCGIHTLFMQEKLPFESFEAHMLSQAISASIKEQADKATKDMAVELGEPEWCKGYGVRNTHLIAIAPTKSTALLMGGVSEGINPDPAMSYTQTTAAGEMDRINPILLDLMKSKGVYSKKHIQEITDNQGSVQKVQWLTHEEKEVFKTAFEINQKAVLRLASARSIYIDQWQSLNLFFSADEAPEWIAEVHQEAFTDPNILALYYVYTQAGVQASKGECEACQ
jgi:ribonucleoside-diphosphate reductase alpha chain